MQFNMRKAEATLVIFERLVCYRNRATTKGFGYRI